MTMTYTQVLPPNSETMPDLAEYLTTQEAARILGYHVESIRNMLRSGELQGIKWRREWLVSKGSVEKYRVSTAGMEKFDPRRGNQ